MMTSCLELGSKSCFCWGWGKMKYALKNIRLVVSCLTAASISDNFRAPGSTASQTRRPPPRQSNRRQSAACSQTSSCSRLCEAHAAGEGGAASNQISKTGRRYIMRQVEKRCFPRLSLNNSVKLSQIQILLNLAL